MIANQLTEDEVWNRLRMLSAENLPMLEEIYAFGQMLVRQVVDDIQHLDSKAAALAAYAGGIVTLLASSGVWHVGTSVARYGLVLAGLIAAVAAVYAVKARTLQEFHWFSQSDWLRKECLMGKDNFYLRQFRVVTMWQVISSCRHRHERKARTVVVAQYFLVASVAILAFSLLSLLFKVPSFCSLKHIFGLW